MNTINSSEPNITVLNKPVSRDSVFFGSGSKDPDVIFVTEASKKKINQKTLQHEVSCFDSYQSSDFFISCLKECEINKYYLTGGMKDDFETEDENHMILKLEIEILKPQLVVALGRKAEKMLLKVKDISFGFRWFEVLPHPSFWLTFYSPEKNEYSNLLRDIKRKINAKNSISF